MIFDKTVAIKQLNVVEAHGLLIFRADKGTSYEIYPTKLRVKGRYPIIPWYHNTTMVYDSIFTFCKHLPSSMYKYLMTKQLINCIMTLCSL